jgi:chromosome partitioning protein
VETESFQRRSGIDAMPQTERSEAEYHVVPMPRRDVSAEGVHPAVVVQDVLSRPRPNGHVIVFANEKGGVGKSTLAFHCTVALCDAGHKVAVVDLDRHQQTLTSALSNRDATARSLHVELPSPRYTVLRQHSGAQLSQEITRIGSGCDFIVIDVAGHDCAIARNAIALADTLVTPVNSSFVDIDLLGKLDPVTMHLKEPGHFGRLVNELREERARCGIAPLDWIVMKNRARTAEVRQHIRIDAALQRLAGRIGFRIGHGLNERVAYRELFLFGLTHLDLKRIPGLARMQARTGAEILRLVSDLALPEPRTPAKSRPAHVSAKVTRGTAEAFGASLYAVMNPVAAAQEQVIEAAD